MLQTISCVTVACDHCADGWADEDYRPHFDSHTEAVQEISERGWEQAEGSRWLCRHCAARHHCTSHGHRFGPWEPCRCTGRITTDPTRPDGSCAAVLRWCQRCSHFELQNGPANSHLHHDQPAGAFVARPDQTRGESR